MNGCSLHAPIADLSLWRGEVPLQGGAQPSRCFRAVVCFLMSTARNFRRFGQSLSWGLRRRLEHKDGDHERGNGEFHKRSTYSAAALRRYPSSLGSEVH